MSQYNPLLPSEIPLLDLYEDIVLLILQLPGPADESAVAAIRDSPVALSNLAENLNKLKLLSRTPAVSMSLSLDEIQHLYTTISLRYSREIVIDGLSIFANALLVNISLLHGLDLRNVIGSIISLYSSYATSLTPQLLYIFRRLGFLFTYHPNILTDAELELLIPLGAISLRCIGKDVYALRTLSGLDFDFTRLSVIEVMKSMYNLLHNYPEKSLQRFQQNYSMQDICRGICFVESFTPETTDIAKYTFNCLMCASSLSYWFNLDGFEPDEDITASDLLYPQNRSPEEFELIFTKPVSSSTLLSKILDYALFVTHPSNTDTLLSDSFFSSCLTCLYAIISSIYCSDRPETPKILHLRAIAESYLLPPNNDSSMYALGDAPHTLPIAFSRFSTDISLSTCTNLVRQIYFKLCHENHEELISRMGFGFASGFLSGPEIFMPQKNIPNDSDEPKKFYHRIDQPPKPSDQPIEPCKSSVSTMVQSDYELSTNIVSTQTNSTVTSSSSDQSVYSQARSLEISQFIQLTPKRKTTKRQAPGRTKRDDSSISSANSNRSSLKEALTSLKSTLSFSSPKRNPRQAPDTKKLAPAPPKQEDDWTEEEKEREAEKLFVLFDRMKTNSAIHN